MKTQMMTQPFGPRAVAETGASGEGPQGTARGLFASPHITHRLCVDCDEVLAGNPQTIGRPGANVLREGHCPVCEQTAREHLVILFLLNHLRLAFEEIPPRARVLALTRGWIRQSNFHDPHFVPCGQLAAQIHAAGRPSTEAPLS